jgi:enoyl-CoA hydratase/carnithine racemase
VGMVRAREILIRARLVSAAEAKTIGLADEVYPGAALEARVREQAERLTEHAPLTMAAVKGFPGEADAELARPVTAQRSRPDL